MKRARQSRRQSPPQRRATRHRMLSPWTWLARHAQVALDSLGRLTRQPLATLMTASVIGIALALPASLYLLLDNMDRLSGAWDGQASLSVFLKDPVSVADADELAKRIRNWPEITEVTLVTPEQALEEFRQGSGFADVLDTLDENPLPAVLLVLPAPEHTNPQSAATLQGRLQALPETEQAQLDLQWVQRLTAILALAQRGVLLISGLLALAVLLVVGNTIRLEIQNRHAEIVVTKLIGATDGFIRRQFLYSGMWYGVIGALLAWLLVEAGFWLLASPVRQLADLYQSSFELQTLPFQLLLVLLTGSVLLGLFGSWLAVGRHLGAIEPS